MARFTEKFLLTLLPEEAALLDFVAQRRAITRVQAIRSAIRAYAKSLANDLDVNAFEGFLRKRLSNSGNKQTAELTPSAQELCGYLRGDHANLKATPHTQPAKHRRPLFPEES